MPRQRNGGPDAASSCVAHRAINTPPMAPAAESTRLSASSCRTIRHRLAPSAARTASSRARPVPRASSRFATLAHAMSSTHADGAEPGEQAQPDVGDQPVGIRGHSCADRGVVLGKPLLEIASHRHQAILRLCPRDARRQAAKDREVVLVVRRLALRRKRDGHPERAVVGQIVEVLRHHADDHVRAVVEANRASNHRGIGGEAPDEQPVTQDDDTVAARAVLFGAQHASVQGGHAEQLEEPARHLAGQHPLGFGSVGEVDVGVVDRGQVREQVGGRGTPVHEVARRDIARLVTPELGDKAIALGFGKRQRPQHDGVDDAEDRGGRADAQRDGQHGGGGEPRAPFGTAGARRRCPVADREPRRPAHAPARSGDRCHALQSSPQRHFRRRGPPRRAHRPRASRARSARPSASRCGTAARRRRRGQGCGPRSDSRGGIVQPWRVPAGLNDLRLARSAGVQACTDRLPRPARLLGRGQHFRHAAAKRSQLDTSRRSCCRPCGVSL